jgi:hypothetical protein
LNRQEAIDLLREIASQNFFQPSLVTIEKNEHGTFSLILKANDKLMEIRAFLANKKDLMLFEDKETGISTIYEP